MPTDVVDVFDTDIVAIAGQDKEENIYVYYLPEPIRFGDIDFQVNYFSSGNVIINFDWFETILVCSEKELQELLENNKDLLNS